MKNVPVAKSETIEAEISDLAYGGEGFAKYQNFAVFIPYGVPGDRVKAVINEVKPNYARAEITSVISRSSSYREPECPAFMTCGGCSWLHTDYKTQLFYKKKFVLKNLSLPEESPEITGYEDPFFYRMRAQYKLAYEKGELKCGFYKAGSHDVCDVKKCYIVRPEINSLMDSVRALLEAEKKVIQFYDEKSHSGYLRHIAVRVNSEGHLLLTFIVLQDSLKPYLKQTALALMDKHPELKGVTLNINTARGNRVFGEKENVIAGQEFITENFMGTGFKLKSDTFFQINTAMLAVMADFIGAHTGSGVRLLDLYGGVGALSLPFRERFEKLTVLEMNREAVRSLKKTAWEAKIENIEAVEGDADKEALPMLSKHEYDLVIIDPPRKGASKGVIEALKKHPPKKIIYISCNPATLGRDMKELSAVFETAQTGIFDLFPQTYHVETAVVLNRR